MLARDLVEQLQAADHDRVGGLRPGRSVSAVKPVMSANRIVARRRSASLERSTPLAACSRSARERRREVDAQHEPRRVARGAGLDEAARILGERALALERDEQAAHRVRRERAERDLLAGPAGQRAQAREQRLGRGAGPRARRGQQQQRARPRRGSSSAGERGERGGVGALEVLDRHDERPASTPRGVGAALPRRPRPAGRLASAAPASSSREDAER